MKRLLAIAALALLAPAASVLAQEVAREADAILGVWLTADGKARVEISRQEGKYHGRIIWLKEPVKNGKEVVDDKNPDEKLRDRPVLGITLMRDFVYDEENVWVGGRVYDPESGNDYKGKVRLVDEKTLDLRGYVLIPLFGRTETWTRVLDAPAEIPQQK
jgi:uncharacterized protein (DUF2147 family)